MTTRIRGPLAAAALCALLSACGGDGGTPATALPDSVSIAADARVETGASAHFKTSLAATEGLSFRWDFGDGSTGDGATPDHAYVKTGSYQVTVAVANADEVLRTATWTIRVGNYSNVAGLDCTQPDSAGWCWQNSGATAHAISDVFFLDATHAWAVGAAGTILRSVDGGDTWTTVHADAASSMADLLHVRFYDASHGLVTTRQGGVLQTADGGATWAAPAGQLPNGWDFDIAAFDATQIVLGAGYAGYSSHDGGQTWTMFQNDGRLVMDGQDCWSGYYQGVERSIGCVGTATQTALPLPAAFTQGYVQQLAFSSSTQALALGMAYPATGFWYVPFAWSTTDGSTWTAFQPTGLDALVNNGYVLSMRDAQTGWAYSFGYGLLAAITGDGGHSWTTVATPAFLAQAGSVNTNAGVAGGHFWEAAGSRLAIRADDGSWQQLAVHAEDPQPGDAYGPVMTLLQYRDANNLVATTNGRYYTTHDGGATWRRVLGPDPRDAGAGFSASWFFDAKHGLVLNSDGGLLSTTDGGRTWSRRDYPTTSQQPVALHFTSATAGWLLLDGRLSQTTDGGVTWSLPLVDSSMAGLVGMSWGDATHAWAFNGGTVFATADGGATWQPLALDLPAGITSAAMSGPTSGVVATYAGLRSTADGGKTWTTQPAVYGTITHTTGQVLWALNGSGAMRSPDGGTTWEGIGFANGGNFTAIAFADDLHGWLVGYGGLLFYTIDGGNSWMKQDVGADLTLTSVTALDATTAWIGTSNGQFLATATGGL